MLDATNVDSLATFERSFMGQAHQIFNKLPQDLLQKGNCEGWCKVMKEGQRLLSKTCNSVGLKRKTAPVNKAKLTTKKTRVYTAEIETEVVRKPSKVMEKIVRNTNVDRDENINVTTVHRK